MKGTRQSGRDHALLRPAALLLLACCSLWSGVSHADQPDPAGRVARISYLLGNVYVQTDTDNDWTPAGINQPLTSGAELRTDPRARAELQLGSATVQIDANTRIQLTELSDAALQLQVTDGLVNVRVRSLDEHDRVEITTPNSVIAVREPGTYRIDASNDGAVTVVQVRAGQVQVDAGRQRFTLHANEQMRLSSGARVAAEFESLPVMDEFDRWAAQRQQRAERALSARYVSSEVIGYEDLDEYGNWSWYADYGYVWTPRYVHAGWAPYRSGRWGWMDPWGWTWIDTAPWGFAPFHYGRWATVRNRWCWVPGPRTVRPIYAPALVAWVSRPGINVSVNIGSQPVGWIPLGPREVYRPVYRSSQNYMINVNRGSSRFDHDELERGMQRQPHENQYRNHTAVSIVPAAAMSNARPVNNQLMRQNGVPLQTIEALPTGRPEGQTDHGFNGHRDELRDGRSAPTTPQRDLPINQPINPPSRDSDDGRAMPAPEPTLRQRSIVTSPYVRPSAALPENGPGIAPAPLQHHGNLLPRMQEPATDRPQMHRGMPLPPPENAAENMPQTERNPPRPWSGNQGHQGDGQPRFESPPMQREPAQPAPLGASPGNAQRSPNREDRGNRQRQGDRR
jgi:FecR protein